MNHIRLFLIRVVDSACHLVFQHRWTWLCSRVVRSSWWDAGLYLCPRCYRGVVDGFFGHGCGEQ